MNRAVTNAEICSLFSVPEHESALLETGYSKPLHLICLEDKESIINVVTDYHCIIKPKAPMDQFLEGLECGDVAEAMKVYPAIMKSLFCPSASDLTAGIYNYNNNHNNYNYSIFELIIFFLSCIVLHALFIICIVSLCFNCYCIFFIVLLFAL